MRTEPIVFLPLSRGKVAVIDFSDFELVRGFKYSVKTKKRNFYAVRGARSPTTGRATLSSLHRDLMDLKAGDGLLIDHIDYNGLNNTRANLRICSNTENSRHRRSTLGSTSKFLGVCRYKLISKWVAQGKLPNISREGRGKQVCLGRFDSEVDAAHAYDAFAREHYGEFANCNFPAPTPP